MTSNSNRPMDPTEDPRSLNWQGWINADGTSMQIDTITNKISGLNAEISALTTERAGLADKQARSAGRTCTNMLGGKVQHAWTDAQGRIWCGPDSEISYQNAIARIRLIDARLDAINSTDLPKARADLDSLIKVQGEKAKTDPDTINAQASLIATEGAAAKALQDSKNKSIVYWAVGGGILAIVIGIVFYKVFRKK